jgi:hypothetical protein
METEFFTSVIRAITWILLLLAIVVILQKALNSFFKWNKRRKKTLSTRKRYNDFVINKKNQAFNQIL